jgi:general L-amino acid transport system substrate-binding protein
MFLAVGALPALAGTTLENIKTRGELRCGVNTSLVGFSSKNAIGKWTGLDVDVCRAIAAAVLGSDQKVRYVPLTATQRLTALQQDEIDILSRNTTFTLARDASMGLRQTVVTYYDGQGFMVPVKNKIARINQLRGQAVCVREATTSTYKSSPTKSWRPRLATIFWACVRRSRLMHQAWPRPGRPTPFTPKSTKSCRS